MARHPSSPNTFRGDQSGAKHTTASKTGQPRSCHQGLIVDDCSIRYLHDMNTRHRKTLEAISCDPVNGNIEWRKIEALFVALGAQIVEGRGSRISVVLNGVRADFHRPHPGKEALRYRVLDARNLLKQAGVTP